MSSQPDQLKGYILEEFRNLYRARGLEVTNLNTFEDFAQAIANAVDKYLKDDVKVDMGITTQGSVTSGLGIGGGVSGQTIVEGDLV